MMTTEEGDRRKRRVAEEEGGVLVQDGMLEWDDWNPEAGLWAMATVTATAFDRRVSSLSVLASDWLLVVSGCAMWPGP